VGGESCGEGGAVLSQKGEEEKICFVFQTMKKIFWISAGPGGN